jgi:PAS domain S-box-containing protein
MQKRTTGRGEIEILIVEDSPTQAEHLRFILEEGGFAVSVASNGKEALSRLRMRRPDIVVTDIVMPEMDGYELCRQIRTELNFMEMPIILVTALSDPTDVVKGLEVGGNNFVTKPYDEKYLFSRIDYLIENRKLRRDSKTEDDGNVFFAGRNYHIAAERLQILDLLLSTYENAYRQNVQLLAVQKELTELNERLEETVRERDREIIERKQAEGALRRQADMINLSYEAMFAWEINGSIVSWNLGAARLYGFDEEEAVGRLPNVLLQTTFPVGLENIVSILRRQGTFNGELFHIAKDGKTIAVESRMQLIADASGKQTVLEINRDITERKAGEEALKKSVERLDILSNTASELLVSETPQCVVETLCRRIMEHLDCQVFFNFLVDDARNCLRLNAYAGVPKEIAREIQFLDFGVAVCGCAARDASRIVAENIPTKPDIRTDLVRSFGIKAYACHPLFAVGRVIGTLSFGTKTRLTFSNEELSLMKTVADQVATAMERIRLLESARERADELESRVRTRTEELQQAYDKLLEETRERERAEQQLRQAQKMEALGTLAGGIAHDFNNMLAAIIGFSEIAKDKMPQDGTVQRPLTRVLEAGIRGRELVKRMLTFARQTEQEKKPLPLSSIIKETAELLRASIPTTIRIGVSISSESGFVLADPIQIQQVIMNLCTNSAHAMREKGGSLELDLSDFAVSSRTNPRGIKPGSYMRLTVRDTGTGMPPEIMDKIFDPFFTTKRPGEGTGLGLSVVHGIVEQHEGCVTVESELGKGALFSIYLPKVAEETPIEAATDNVPLTGHERVLFVDDEEVLAEMGQELLEGLGYKVTVKGSSIEALSAIKADPNRFDLVITDQTMPEMTGVELAKEVLAIKADMPIIMCTGFSYLVDADKARAAGIKAFAMKPLTKREIAGTIRKVLDG